MAYVMRYPQVHELENGDAVQYGDRRGFIIEAKPDHYYVHVVFGEPLGEQMCHVDDLRVLVRAREGEPPTIWERLR